MGPDNSPVSASFSPINPVSSFPNMGTMMSFSENNGGGVGVLSFVVLRSTKKKDAMTGSRFPANHPEKTY